MFPVCICFASSSDGWGVSAPAGIDISNLVCWSCGIFWLNLLQFVQVADTFGNRTLRRVGLSCQLSLEMILYSLCIPFIQYKIHINTVLKMNSVLIKNIFDHFILQIHNSTGTESPFQLYRCHLWYSFRYFEIKKRVTNFCISPQFVLELI